jgi:hypothetical protein
MIGGSSNMNTNTITELTELKKLKKAIRSGCDAVRICVKTAKQRNTEAVKEAVLCGDNLRKAKDLLGHGGFTKWMKNELSFSDSDIRMAQDWMRLSQLWSKTKSFSDLPPTSLQEAYRLCGIIENEEATHVETVPVQATPTAPPAPPTLAASNATSPAPLLTIAPAPACTEKVEPKQAQAAPAGLTADEVLSRTRYLVKELISDLTNKIMSNSITLPALEEAALKPIQAFFTAARAQAAYLNSEPSEAA